ncbi:MAG: hypothetical protein KIT11_09065 [Fimbriimonadaceae bacterium]|nr:hypothetical protein [Fimbriimonadaceae bacterium]QYK55477.1 MAG: hypothetical protein KF733_10735 [Fimbriimonadaceae bacterium]
MPRSAALATFFVLVSPVIASAQDADNKTRDLSGEPTLRQILKDTAAVRNVYVSIARYGMQTDGERVPESSALTLWFKEPGVYRLYWTEAMGGGNLLVNDGKTLLRDGLGSTVFLSNSEPSLSAGSATDVRQSTSLVCWLFDGEAVWEKLVQMDSDIKLAGETVEFKAPNLGTVRIGFRSEGPRKLPTFVEIRAAATGQARSPFGAAAIQRDEVSVWREKSKFAPWVFDTTPAPGISVTDRRGAPKDGW